MVIKIKNIGLSIINLSLFYMICFAPFLLNIGLDFVLNLSTVQEHLILFITLITMAFFYTVCVIYFLDKAINYFLNNIIIEGIIYGLSIFIIFSGALDYMIFGLWYVHELPNVSFFFASHEILEIFSYITSLLLFFKLKKKRAIERDSTNY